MLNKMTSGIAAKLAEEFGEDYKIYTKTAEQGLTAPYFLITSLSSSQTAELGRRYIKSNLFSVQYFPSSEDAKAECRAVYERLADCLEYITAGGIVRCSEFSAQIADDVLTATVGYNVLVFKAETETEKAEKMESIENVKIKSGARRNLNGRL